MKWPEHDGSDPDIEPLEYDPFIVFEDVEQFIDPMLVTRAIGDLPEDISLKMDAFRTLVEGIQVHSCPYATPGTVYVVDRQNVVDSDGNCLVCGEATI